jgi:hypothetical protein
MCVLQTGNSLCNHDRQRISMVVVSRLITVFIVTFVQSLILYIGEYMSVCFRTAHRILTKLIGNITEHDKLQLLFVYVVCACALFAKLWMKSVVEYTTCHMPVCPRTSMCRIISKRAGLGLNGTSCCNLYLY